MTRDDKPMARDDESMTRSEAQNTTYRSKNQQLYETCGQGSTQISDGEDDH